MSEGQEKDYLKYQGNAVPRIIRFAWTAFFIFGLIYLGLHFWPNLQSWMNR